MKLFKTFNHHPEMWYPVSVLVSYHEIKVTDWAGRGSLSNSEHSNGIFYVKSLMKK